MIDNRRNAMPNNEINGKTPYQTFLDSKKIANEKNLSNIFDNKWDNLNNEN